MIRRDNLIRNWNIGSSSRKRPMLHISHNFVPGLELINKEIFIHVEASWWIFHLHIKHEATFFLNLGDMCIVWDYSKFKSMV